MEIKQMILEGKVKQATMVEVAYNDAQMEVVNFQNNVAIANLESISLEKEEAKISQIVATNAKCHYGLNLFYILIGPKVTIPI